MRWADEWYVRLYTRDSMTWEVWPWQSRALLGPLIRKLDRTGAIDVGEYGYAGLAAVVKLPVELVTEGVAGMLKTGTLVEVQGGLMMPNFLVAQETPQSDAQRKREQRARDRATRIGPGSGPDVTIRDEPSVKSSPGHGKGSESHSPRSEQIRAEQSSLSGGPVGGNFGHEGEAWASGIREVRGKCPPPTPLDMRDYILPAGKEYATKLRGDELFAWYKSSAEAFARDSKVDPKFGGYTPRRWVTWLSSQPLEGEAPALLVAGAFGMRQLGPSFGPFAGCDSVESILGNLDSLLASKPIAKAKIEELRALARRGREALESKANGLTRTKGSTLTLRESLSKGGTKR